MTVYLVGAGPGDPGLLTVRGAEVLRTRRRGRLRPALGRPASSTWRPAGGRADQRGQGARSRHDAPGRDRRACSSSGVGPAEQVVRLKGGDPFVFARGGEEAAGPARRRRALRGGARHLVGHRRAGLCRHPGHHAALVDLVHRDHRPRGPGQGRRARLGGGRPARRHHRDPHGGGPPGRRSCAGCSPAAWPPTRRPPRSAGAPGPSSTRCGPRWPPSTDHDLASPRTIVIGGVAGLDLDWFESRPLFGRARGGHPGPARRPRSSPPGSAALGAELDRGAGHRGRRSGRWRRGAGRRGGRLGVDYDWVVLTSPNGARRLLDAVHDARDLGGVRVAAIGPGTADGAAGRGNIVADLVPERFVAEALLEAFPAPPAGGRAGAAGPGRGGPRRAARRAAGRGLGGRRGRRLPHRGRAGRRRQRGPRWPPPTSSPSPRRRRSSASSTAFGVDAVPPVVACIGPVTSATARDARPRGRRRGHRRTRIDGLVDALVRPRGDR